MRLCNLMMRPFSEGVVMGTDEMYWPAETDEMTVGKYVATTVFSGVPAIGANLLDGPPPTQKSPKLGWGSIMRINLG